ncbi:hypothetical protein GCM10019996_12300 [Lentilactobacillus parakefiri]
MRLFLNQTKSGGISRVTNREFDQIGMQLGILMNLTYKERSIWKVNQRNYHLNIISSLVQCSSGCSSGPEI